LARDVPAAAGGFFATSSSPDNRFLLLATTERAKEDRQERIFRIIGIKQLSGGPEPNPGLAERLTNLQPVEQVRRAREPLHFNRKRNIDLSSTDILEQLLDGGAGVEGFCRDPGVLIDCVLPWRCLVPAIVLQKPALDWERVTFGLIRRRDPDVEGRTHYR
jgi:hypothetical protein